MNENDDITIEETMQLFDSIKKWLPLKPCNNFECPARCGQVHSAPQHMGEGHPPFEWIPYIIGEDCEGGVTVSTNKSVGELGSIGEDDFKNMWKFVTYSPSMVETLLSYLSAFTDNLIVKHSMTFYEVVWRESVTNSQTAYAWTTPNTTEPLSVLCKSYKEISPTNVPLPIRVQAVYIEMSFHQTQEE